MSVLVFVEQSNHGPVSSSLEVLGKAKSVAAELGLPLAAVVLGSDTAATAQAGSLPKL